MSLKVEDLQPGHTYKIPVRIQESWDRWGYVTVEIPKDYDPEFITELLDEAVSGGGLEDPTDKGGAEIDVDDTEEIEEL